MRPVFDKSGSVVGWVNDNVIFDMNSDPCAFINDEAVFSYQGKHLGWLNRGFFRDQSGDAVGFVENATGQPLLPTTAIPPIPAIPSMPPLPPMPPLPSPNWSLFSWSEFLS